MEKEQAKKIVESLLYMTDHPLTKKEILEVLDVKSIKEAEMEEMLFDIKQSYDDSGSGLSLIEVAGGWQMATRPEMATWIRRLYKERLTVRLSPSALETLSIIAYKQPIARSDIEQIRGVEASGVVDTLVERRLIKVVGRKETIGRPLLYGTTTEFLRQFGLRHLADLPDLATISAGDLSSDAQEEEKNPDQQELELVSVGGESNDEPAQPEDNPPPQEGDPSQN